MNLILNKRLLIPAIILLGAYNILPIGLLSYKNLDPLKLITILLLFIGLIQTKNLFEKDNKYVSFFICSIFLSVLNMFSRGKYLDWTFFYCLNYLNFFVLLKAFQKSYDINDYLNLLLVLSLLASLLHAIFFMYPDLLTGVLTDIRMGSINYDTTKLRIFIPGMGFIAICFTYLICKIFYYKKLNYWEFALLGLFFLSIFIFSSVRTNLLGLFICILVFLMTGKLSFKSILIFTLTGAAMLSILALISTDLYQFIASRFDIFFKLGDFKLLDVLNLDIDYDNETTWGTIYFRILEVIYVLQNFTGDLKSILLGNIGILYDFLGVEQEPAPHVGIVGIYYLFGLVGLITFLIMFVKFSKILIQNVYKTKNTKFEFLSLSLVVIWFSLFAISLFGGVYYSELILLVTFVMAAAVFIKNKFANEGIEDQCSNA